MVTNEQLDDLRWKCEAAISEFACPMPRIGIAADQLAAIVREVQALRAELAECRKDAERYRAAEIALAARSIDERYANRLAGLLECALMGRGGGCWDDGMALLDEYYAEWRAISGDPVTFMGEPIPMQAASGNGGK